MYSIDHTRGRAVTPLPNPGEGGPVNPGNTPGSLLPGPGEGGPINSGDTPGSMLPGPDAGGPADPGNRPVTLLPNPGEGGPVDPGNAIPIIPLPEISEGGPVGPGRPGSIIIQRPQPNPPCYSCAPGRNARVRFLNAAYGYRPFRLYINNRFLANGLGYASLTPYGRVANGFQTVTVTGMNGYIYLQKSMPIRSGETVTIAIINTPGGIDLLQISDTPCSRPAGMSCLRAANLAANTNPLDVVLTDERVVFSDVRFKEVTAYRRARQGEYLFYLAETNLRPMPRFWDIETVGSDAGTLELPKVLVSFYVDISANANYTVYILSLNNDPDSVQVLTIEDR